MSVGGASFQMGGHREINTQQTGNTSFIKGDVKERGSSSSSIGSIGGHKVTDLSSSDGASSKSEIKYDKATIKEVALVALRNEMPELDTMKDRQVKKTFSKEIKELTNKINEKMQNEHFDPMDGVDLPSLSPKSKADAQTKIPDSSKKSSVKKERKVSSDSIQKQSEKSNKLEAKSLTQNINRTNVKGLSNEDLTNLAGDIGKLRKIQHHSDVKISPKVDEMLHKKEQEIVDTLADRMSLGKRFKDGEMTDDDIIKMSQGDNFVIEDDEINSMVFNIISNMGDNTFYETDSDLYKNDLYTETSVMYQALEKQEPDGPLGNHTPLGIISNQVDPQKLINMKMQINERN